MRNRKIISLISGGMDSCTVVGRLAIEGYEVFPIYVDYGQKVKKRELNAAKKYLDFLQRKKYNVHDLVVSRVSLPFLKIPMTGHGQIPKSNEKNFFSLSSKKIDYVPGRNIIFLSIATSYAIVVGSDKISIGAYKEDELPPYPDSSREFFDSMEKTLSLGTYIKVKIITPFINQYKWDIVKYSEKHGLPIHLTWSCYENGKRHCGMCRNCVDRKKAFRKAGVEDPTEYVHL